MQFFSKQLSTIVFLMGLFLVLSGCMKTRIVTDQQPSNRTVDLPWAHGFVYGLVPPVNAPLETEGSCGSAGVAEVFFRQTFVQGIAQGLTGSLYSPQQFTATCAAGGGMSSTTSPPAYLREESTPSPQVSVSSSAVSASPNAERKPNGQR